MTDAEGSDPVFQLDGRRYVWTGKTWHDERTFIKPPLSILIRLNGLMRKQLEKKDDLIVDIQELLETAKVARNSDNPERAIRLLERVLASDPKHAGALAVLCSTYRGTRRPEAALEAANRAPESNYPPLITTRAAALCDLGRWSEALSMIRRAIASSPSRSEAANLVYSRIKAEAPHLFKDRGDA